MTEEEFRKGKSDFLSEINKRTMFWDSTAIKLLRGFINDGYHYSMVEDMTKLRMSQIAGLSR